jgi:hypothetical protein
VVSSEDRNPGQNYANVPRNGRCHGSEYTSHDLERGTFYLANGGAHKGYISKKLNIPLDAKLPFHVTRTELSATNIFIASATIFLKDIYYTTSDLMNILTGQKITACGWNLQRLAQACS